MVDACGRLRRRLTGRVLGIRAFDLADVGAEAIRFAGFVRSVRSAAIISRDTGLSLRHLVKIRSNGYGLVSFN